MNEFFYLISEEKPGGLFDFDATLPLIALQFMLLTLILKFILYSPILSILEKRQTFLSSSLYKVSNNLANADKSLLGCIELLTETKLIVKDNIKIRLEALDNSLSLIVDDFQKQYVKNEKSINDIFILARWEALEYFLQFSTLLTFQSINFFTIRGETWDPSLSELEKNSFHQIYVKNLEEGGENEFGFNTISGY